MEMIILACLGNPGTQYRGTRHNVGFAVAEKLASRFGITLTTKGFFGLYGTAIVSGKKVVVIEPQTFMNDSGRCVEAIRHYYQVDPENVWVIYDDIDMDEGRLRIRLSGSAGTHNGMRSIVAHLGTQKFPRLRVGVGKPAPGRDLVDHVLGRPSLEGQEKLHVSTDKAVEAIEIMLRDGADLAMQFANRVGVES